MSRNQLGLLLACYPEPRGATKARRPLDGRLRAGGDVLLDTVVLKVNAKHKASVHDPRRVLMGTLTPALTWGLFGLIASGWLGFVVWAVVGAICGGSYAYFALHHATKAQLKHIGKRLPANASALLTFAETRDPDRLLAATSGDAPNVVSVATIADDLSARVSVGGDGQTSAGDDAAAQRKPPSESPVSSMIMVRYPKPDAAKEAASQLAAQQKGTTERAEVELVVKIDRNGKRHVADPKFGVATTVKNDVVGWGAFGFVVGAIAGASGGGILEGGVVTGIAWAIFGVFAGLLFGLWAGRSISARRLKGIGPILAPGTSMLLAWADGRVADKTVAEVSSPGADRLILGFKPTGHGAVLEVP